MKRFLVLGLLLIAAVSFAQEKVVIQFFHQGDTPYDQFPYWKDTAGFKTPMQKWVAAFQMLNPGVTIDLAMQDLSTGAALTLDAALAAGKPPDLVEAAEGVVAKLMTEDYAIDFSKYVYLGDYMSDALKVGQRNGKQYALPDCLSSSAPTWNQDMLDEIGYKIPALDKWTTDEFLSLARKLKAKNHYITALFFKNQSSDMWWMNWFYAFGARQYAPNNYTKSTLNSPEALKALKFMKQLVDEQLVPPNPGEIDDDMALDMWGKGQIAMLSMQIGHTGVVQSYVDQKIIPKVFKMTMSEFPHAAGLKHTPVYTGPTLVVGHKSGSDYKDNLISKWAEIATGFERQYTSSASGNFPTRYSVAQQQKNASDLFPIQMNIVATAGIIDRGAHLPVFMKTRAAMWPLMQDYMAGKMTAENVLKNYEKAINDILAGK